MCMESARIDQVGRQLVDGANANEMHVSSPVHPKWKSETRPKRKTKPVTHPEDLECLLDAVLSVRTERVHERTPDTDS